MKYSTENAVDHSFSLRSVVELLKTEGFIDSASEKNILRGAGETEKKLKNQIRSTNYDSQYFSPIEIIASMGIPVGREGGDACEKEIFQNYASAARIPFISIDPLKLDAKSVCDIISKPFARKNLLVPVKLKGDRLTVAMVNPFDKEVVQGLEDVTGYKVEPMLGLRNEILKTINEIFAFEHSLIKAEKSKLANRDFGNLEQLVDISMETELDASDHHIIKAVDLLLQYAYEQLASDIHIEPKRDKAVVRLRIDGRLQTTHSIPKKVYPSFTSRIKIMAALDIAEKRKPQDGRIKTKNNGIEIELRISTVPVAFGEKIVIRIFDPNILLQDVSSLGFLQHQLDRFKRMLKKPYGIILVTGPTGSGKTTCLYSALKFLASPEVNITTIEDPIEMVYESFNQIAVHSQVDLNFTTALRHVLRQDPDIIMIGEIRDHETAEYAVQAALTGHLVLTTLHTNNAAGAITRLRDLEIESFLIASTLIGVIAQRLVRKICSHCQIPAAINPEQMHLLGMKSNSEASWNLMQGRGCQRCRNTGFKGRIGVFEILEVDENLRALIRDDEDESAISAAARKAGTEPLLNTAVRNLVDGKTTIDEILRVIPLIR